jgi:hypothetical protein
MECLRVTRQLAAPQRGQHLFECLDAGNERPNILGPVLPVAFEMQDMRAPRELTRQRHEPIQVVGTDQNHLRAALVHQRLQRIKLNLQPGTAARLVNDMRSFVNDEELDFPLAQRPFDGRSQRSLAVLQSM